MLKHLYTLAAAVVVTVGLAGAVRACEPNCVMKKVTQIEWVTTWETRREPYQKNFTLYDDCGRPYTVERTCYRDVKVPVRKPVPVEKWIKVCY